MSCLVSGHVRVLPTRKMARFYQVESKLRALLNYDLTRGIPLLR